MQSAGTMVCVSHSPKNHKEDPEKVRPGAECRVEYSPGNFPRPKGGGTMENRADHQWFIGKYEQLGTIAY